MKFLKKIFFGALLLVDARIVRQVVGDRLVAVPQIAGAERRVHHFHRRRDARASTAGPRPASGSASWMSGTYFLNIASFAALGLVADQDRGAVRGLHAEQVVEVGLVGREDDVELRVLQVDPREVARVVVVGEQRVGAQAQKVGERLVVADRGRVAQMPRRRLRATACT